MTDRELMQRALDAFELLARYENPSTKVQVRKPRDGGPIVTMYPHKVATEAAVPLRVRLAQPEQEPVAWMYDWYDETEDIDGVPIGGIVHDWISKDYDEAHSPTMGCHNIRPLYTAPPQREWQGLTENDFGIWREPAIGILRWAEAVLKERNK